MPVAPADAGTWMVTPRQKLWKLSAMLTPLNGSYVVDMIALLAKLENVRFALSPNWAEMTLMPIPALLSPSSAMFSTPQPCSGPLMLIIGVALLVAPVHFSL